MDVGTYYLTVANNSHDAVNNIIVTKNLNNEKMDDIGNKELVKTIQVDQARSSVFKYWTLGGTEVTNLFDNADPNKVDPDANKVTFMSRNNWEQTVFSTHQPVNNSEKRALDREYDNANNFSNSKENYPYYTDSYPTYEKKLDKSLMLYDMMGVEYQKRKGASDEDIQKWEDFLDQLSWEDTLKLVANGRRCTESIDSIARPCTNDVNASNGINWKFNLKLNDSKSSDKTGFGNRYDSGNVDLYLVGYPCEGIIASSFNTEIAYIVGQSIGEDALWT